ncbi:hypothetical protein AGMMS49940_00360 [Spirochaetia bacterium]|nr:hypothetical protein AGMMS49940_00360 [Spirochaetia bacterium]
MKDWLKKAGGWPVELETKPDMEKCLERVYAWYEGEILDRPPVRFTRHNAEFEVVDTSGRTWPSLKDRWFDAEYQLEKLAKEIGTKKFLAETFPVYWPNLGPNVFAACYGCPYKYGETTGWAEPMFEEWPSKFPVFDWNSEYVKKLDELTDLAIEQGKDRFLTGYTDIHGGMDLAAAFRGTTPLLTDLYDEPEAVRAWCDFYFEDFTAFYDRYDAKLKEHKQLSVTWLNIPSFGKMHVPAEDFAAMISTEHFLEFARPNIVKECLHMDHNIFHVDGKGVAVHLDEILSLPKLHGIQWVQGMAEDLPILQWIPLIKRILAAGKGVVVDLTVGELEPFIAEVPPKGLYLCISTDSQEQEQEIVKRVEKW